MEAAMVPLLATCVSLFGLIIIPSIIIYKLWLVPLYLQRLMASQGIRGPSYRFFYGNTKEVMRMKQQTNEAPMDLSHDVFPIIQPHFYSWIRLYGENFVHWIGSQPEIVVTEPELIKEILSNKQGIFQKPKAKGTMKNLLGEGITASEGEKWSRLRKLSNHAFHGDCLKEMGPTMSACAESMVEKWRSYVGKEIEVYREFKLVSSEVIARTAFGSSYLEGREIFDLLSKLAVIFFRNMHRIRFVGIGKVVRRKDDLKIEEMEQRLDESIKGVVKRRQEAAAKSGDVESLGSDFLGCLLKAHHDIDPKNQISEREIIDECKTFYFAGHETTASLLSWTTMLLAIHTEWQDKAREEVFQLFGQQNPSSEGLARLKIVNMILYESLRLYSPSTNIIRRTGSKVKLGKYEFPANVNILIPPLAIHRNTGIWGQDAHLFNPERFVQGLAKATNANANVVDFLGFGFGPRTCVGLNFAITQAKIVLSTILQRYKFTLSPNYVPAPYILPINTPQAGVQVLLHSL